MSENLKKAIFFVLLLAVTYVAYRFMIKPANRNLALQMSRLSEKSAKLAEFEEATFAAEGINEQLEQLQNAVEFFESKLPPESEIHKVLEQVTVIAQRQNLEPKSIRTLGRKDSQMTNSSNGGTCYIEQPLKMVLKGNFNSFYSFMLELEKLPRIMKIRELELAKARDAEGQIETDFIVSIFFQDKT